MSIAARGPRNHLVLEESGILSKEIWDAIADHKDTTWLKTRYPISDDDIFECIDALIDLTEADDKDFIELVCVKTGEEPNDIELETRGLTDRIFFSVVSYAKSIYAADTDIQVLYTKGLMQLINDCLNDITNGSSAYTESYLHNKVYESFVNAYGKVGSVDDILTILDKDTLFKSKYND